MAIPSASSVIVSAVVNAPLTDVWHLIKLQDFNKWWSQLTSSEFVKGASDEADIVRWTFKDGTKLDVKQEEHSTIDHSITYGIVSSSETLSYTSQLSKITCSRVTSGQHKDATFVRWTAEFSNDAGADVVEDAKYKREEALADLEKAAKKQ